MPIEIFLSSSDEASACDPIIVSDTSDEEPSPPIADLVAEPTPATRLASRKCAFGASAHAHQQKKKRKFLKNQLPVSPKQERFPTSRRIVKVKKEDGDEGGLLRGQGLPRRKLTDKYRDPLLEEISFPFSLSLRLEEIRLNVQNAPRRPIIRAALAFRHVTQSAKTALRGPSATTFLPLHSPTDGSTSMSASITTSLSLRVVRNPAIPLKPPDLASLDYRQPDQLGELAEVLLLVTISDAAAPSSAEPYYTSAVPISKDRRFQLSGERTTKRAADGTQVTLSWAAELEREGYGYAEPTEAEIDVFIERELRAVEQDWRREVAKRALASATLEAQAPPPHGPPANLVLDPTAPSPSSLIPGLARPPPHTNSPRSFSPVPRYFYTGFATHGVPLVGNLLETFPFLPTWEDAESTNKLVVRQVENVLDPPPEPVKGVEVGRGSQQPVKVEVDPEQRRRLYDFRLETMIDYGSFDAPDVGRTFRDFEVFRRLLHFLQIDLEELAELEAEALRDGATDPHHFAFERSLTPDHVLLKALDVYQRRTGRTACAVQRDHRLISDEELVPQPDPLDICYLCGAFGCILHANLIAYNRSTKPSDSTPVQQKKGCRQCGYRKCKARDKTLQTAASEGDLEKEQKLFDLPPIDACTAALILGRPVSEPSLFHPAPPAPVSKPRGRPWEHLKLLPIASEGYVPCDCQDRCGEDCGCASQATFCDRFCNCSLSCPRRYGGCRDHSCSKAEKCWCRDRGRECVPELCGCSPTCDNSRIRLHRQKATTVARSQIEKGGYGLVLLEAASPGDLMGLYAGELFPQGMSDEIGSQSLESRWGTWKSAFAELYPVSYYFEIDQSDAIDSALLGSGTRFINHDKKRANVVPQVINIAGTHQVALYTTKALKAGDELFMDYGVKYHETWRNGDGS